MRVKYEPKHNEKVLSYFYILVFRVYALPLIINMSLALILFLISFSWLFRPLYDGIFLIPLWEVLLTPVTIIPTVNSLQTIFMITLGAKNIIHGDYVVERFKIYESHKRRYIAANNVLYPKSARIKGFKSNTDRADIISVLNNYGTVIWTLIIPPITLKEDEESEKLESIFTKPVKYWSAGKI